MLLLQMHERHGTARERRDCVNDEDSSPLWAEVHPVRGIESEGSIASWAGAASVMSLESSFLHFLHVLVLLSFVTLFSFYELQGLTTPL